VIPHIVFAFLSVSCALPEAKKPPVVKIKQSVTCDAGCTVEQNVEREGDPPGSITVSPIP